MDNSKEAVSSRHKGTDAHMNSQIGPAQVQIRCKGEMDTGYHQEAICNWSLLTKEKVSFI